MVRAEAALVLLQLRAAGVGVSLAEGGRIAAVPRVPDRYRPQLRACRDDVHRLLRLEAALGAQTLHQLLEVVEARESLSASGTLPPELWSGQRFLAEAELLLDLDGVEAGADRQERVANAEALVSTTYAAEVLASVSELMVIQDSHRSGRRGWKLREAVDDHRRTRRGP